MENPNVRRVKIRMLREGKSEYLVDAFFFFFWMRRICRNEPTHVFAGVGLNAVEVVAGVLDVLRFDEGFQKSSAWRFLLPGYRYAGWG